MKNYFIICCLLAGLSWLSPSWATSVLPLSLEQLSMRASLIFFAEVVDNQTKIDEQSGKIATFTRFEIIDPIKGLTANTHTIKQIGGYNPASKTRLYVHGIPTFYTGGHYVVFLPAESKLGFSSPLGLHQGSYTVMNIDGEQIVSNGRNLTEPPSPNNNISQVPLAINADKPSRSRLVDFINTIRAYNTP